MTNVRAVGDAVVFTAANDARMLPVSTSLDLLFPMEPADKKAPPGGLDFTIVDYVPGQPQPPAHHSWLSLEPFKDLSVDASVLRARMRFLYRFVLFSMTIGGDWQTQLDHHLRDVPVHEFRWFPVLFRLIGGSYSRPQMMRLLATLRWHHPRFLIEVIRPSDRDAKFTSRLKDFLSGLDGSEDVIQLDHQRGSIAKRLRVVELGISLAGSKISAQLLAETFDVLEQFTIAQGQRRDEALASGAHTFIEFRVTALVFGFAVEMDSRALETLSTRLAQSKCLRIDTLRLATDGALERLPLRKCLMDLTSDRRLGLQRLALELTDKAFAAVGSTLRYDMSLREIDVGYQVSEMDVFATWLAFGIFHRDSRSKVTSLCLRMPHRYGGVSDAPPYETCTRRWIDIFKRSLGHVASSKDLAFVHSRILHGGDRKQKKKRAPVLGELRLPKDQRVLVNVRPATKVYEQPVEQAKRVMFTVTTQDEGAHEFEVVRKLEGWVAIVIPGVGVGWVAAKTVVSERMVPTEKKNHSVKSLTWVGGFFPRDEDVKNEHADTLVIFIALIGGPLEVLQLPRMALQNRHVAEIVRCCPNLLELNIAGNDITDIAPLVRAYETGSCRITSLSVGQSGKNHELVLRQIARIIGLCNHRHQTAALATRPILRQLSIRASPYPLNRILQYYDAYSALKKALSHEQGLEYMCVHCHENDLRDTLHVFASFLPRNGEEPHESESDQEYSDDEEEDEWTVLPPPAQAAWRSRLLPLRSRLAFLSVIPQHLRLQVDLSVLHLILEMARTEQPRMVDVVPDETSFAPREYFV